MKLEPTVCPICLTKNDWDIVYPQNFTLHQITSNTFSARRLPDRLHYQMVRCRHDGLVRSTPILSPRDLGKLYGTSRFTYEEEVEHLTTTYLRVVLPILEDLPKTVKILEIGCGNGFLLEALRKAGYHNVWGVEPSIDAVRRAPLSIRKKIQTEMFSSSLFAAHSIDVVLVFQTLDHIPHPDKFLFTVDEVLKPKGIVLSFHHNIESFSSKVLKEKSPIVDIEHTQLFSLETSRKLFERCGFEVAALFSPWSTISLRHLLWLLPIRNALKSRLGSLPLLRRVLSFAIPLQLGNVCVVGRRRV